MENNSPKSTLGIKGRILKNGISIVVEGKEYKVEFPNGIWNKTPSSVRDALFENLVFADTHFLPLVLGKEKISYNTPMPLLESFWFQNQIFDMPSCEKADAVRHPDYIKRFFNLDYDFADGESAIPDKKEVSSFRARSDRAVAPFSFGKESLLTYAICKEAGIKPVLFYCEELSQPYEKEYKLKKLEKFKKEFNADIFFVKNGPGLFRYGVAFGIPPTEVGWGSQTTILSMLAVPFLYKHQAKYVLFGSEFLNNSFMMLNGWKGYISYDQTAFFTKHQNNMVKVLTNNECQVKSVLESLDELTVFYILQKRYPHLLKYLYSCHSLKPLYKDSQWCYNCSKCKRLFMFAKACNLDPEKIGFKKDITKDAGFLDYYFTEKKDQDPDLDMALYILLKRGLKTDYLKQFELRKMPFIKSWKWYRDNYSHIKTSHNLPADYKDKMLKIFKEELKSFEQILPA